MALLCLNRFLDVVEAVEDGAEQAVSFGAVDSVDLPERVCVPPQLWTGEHRLEEVCRTAWQASSLDLHVQACAYA